MNIVVSLYGRLGLDPEEAVTAFWPLVKGTINNIEHRGPQKALTGPISRGDVETIRKHLDVLHTKAPSTLSFYAELGLLTVEIGLKNSSLSKDKAEEILSLLKGDYMS